jgi:hypothetical protein
LKINKRNVNFNELKKQAALIELALFQLFAALNVTQGGFEPPTLRAEI